MGDDEIELGDAIERAELLDRGSLAKRVGGAVDAGEVLRDDALHGNPIAEAIERAREADADS